MPLTPQLNETQLKQNIDAMVKQNAPHDAIQSYVDNYQKGTDGNYTLKNQDSNAPTPTQGNEDVGFNGDFFQGKDVLGDTGNKIANSVTQSEQNFGKDIAQASYLLFGGQKNIDNVTKMHMDNGTKLTDLAKKQTDPNRKALYAKMAIDEFKTAQNVGGKIIGNARTPEQIVGDAIGVGADVLVAGDYGGISKSAGIVEKPAQSILQAAGKGAIKEAIRGGIYGTFKGGASSMSNNESQKDVALSAVKGGATGAVVGGAVGAVTGGIGAAMEGKPLTQPNVTLHKSAVDHAVNDILGYKESPMPQNLQATHPELADKVRNVDLTGVKSFDDLETRLKAGLTPDEIKVLQPELDRTIGTMKTIEPLLNENGKSQFQNEDDLKKIQDTISPKPTAKEAKLAESQGRLIKGNDATFLKGETVDTVLPSERTIRASQTIQSNIPNAANMNEAQLYSALDNKTSEIAQNLKPEMAKVTVTPEVNDKIGGAWADLKKAQFEDSPATEEANVTKLQSKFQSILDKLGKTENPTMDDVWQARQAYDSSIKEGVKKATTLSPESLQLQKEIWLQNRSILNGAINDSSSGLGDTSQKAFSDMTDLYNSKEGILSKAKIDTKVQPSKLVQLIKKHPIISSIVGYLGVNEATGGKAGQILKDLTGI